MFNKSRIGKNTRFHCVHTRQLGMKFINGVLFYEAKLGFLNRKNPLFTFEQLTIVTSMAIDLGNFVSIFGPVVVIPSLFVIS